MSFRVIKGGLIEYCEKETAILIPHIVNDAAAMGSGVALALMNKWPQVRQDYRSWFYKYDGKIHCCSGRAKLGQVQYVLTDDYSERYVVNMVAQSDPGGHTFVINGVEVNHPPIRLQSLEECMYRVAEKIYESYEERGLKFDIVAPWFGCGLAGSSKKDILPLIQRIWVDNGINVTIIEQ
jgi:O-acetyl-ADP-ribose deacetylase (regulator of RNase III)